MSDLNSQKTLQQLEFFDIPSPCIGVCETNNAGFCRGCFRSREERLYWPQVDNATKRVIIQACSRRKKKSQMIPKSSILSPPSQGQLFKTDEP